MIPEALPMAELPCYHARPDIILEGVILEPKVPEQIWFAPAARERAKGAMPPRSITRPRGKSSKLTSKRNNMVESEYPTA